MRRMWVALLVVPVVMAVALPAVAQASPRTPAASSTTQHQGLSYGTRSSSVKSLQQRLAQLKYYPGKIDGEFGMDTQEAVWAFQEAHGLPGADYVSSAMRRDLQHPSAPPVLVPNGGSDRIEVNLARELLVLYKNNKPELISHVSSGGGYSFCNPGGGGCGTAITPTGDYHTIVFMPGWVTVPLGEMYNPVFFIGTAFAIHGDTDVPLQPVSHGCVRIPMDIAAFFHTLVRTPGTPVYLRG